MPQSAVYIVGGQTVYPPSAHTGQQPMIGAEAYESSVYNRALYSYTDPASGWGYSSVTDQSSPDSLANSGE